MKDGLEQALGPLQERDKIIRGENELEERGIPLVLYKKEIRCKVSPPTAWEIFWFWTPNPPSSLKKEDLREIERRLEKFCGADRLREEGKKMEASLFTGIKDGREEGIIMVQVGITLLSEEEKLELIENAPEPPREYPQEERKEE